jgi:hypothetical protein
MTEPSQCVTTPVVTPSPLTPHAATPLLANLPQQATHLAWTGANITLLVVLAFGCIALGLTLRFYKTRRDA